MLCGEVGVTRLRKRSLMADRVSALELLSHLVNRLFPAEGLDTPVWSEYRGFRIRGGADHQLLTYAAPDDIWDAEEQMRERFEEVVGEVSAAWGKPAYFAPDFARLRPGRLPPGWPRLDTWETVLALVCWNCSDRVASVALEQPGDYQLCELVLAVHRKSDE